MDLLDLILVIVAISFAVSGYRQGFVVGVLSFVGFVGGLVLGLWLVPIPRRIRPGARSWSAIACDARAVLITCTQRFGSSCVRGWP